ncbi:hypothetical protein [Natronobacterium haloterrestre]|nr:hypothetical protein [Halobiforma haloterrestris]
MKNIPSLAWVLLFLLGFGIGEGWKVTLIALGTFLPVYLNFSTGIRDVDRALIEDGSEDDERVDDPVSQVGYEQQDFLLEVRERLEQTIVLVTHDVEEAAYLAARVVVLDDQPGSVEREIDVDIARPRDRTEEALVPVHEAIGDAVGSDRGGRVGRHLRDSSTGQPKLYAPASTTAGQ